MNRLMLPVANTIVRPSQQGVPDASQPDRESDAARARRDELEDFFENGPVPLHIVSGDGIILRANKAELDLLGYAREAYIGRSIAEFHADADAIADILARLGRGEKLERHPARLKAKDGSIRHVLLTSSPRFEGGRFINTRCFTQDVTAEIEAKRRAADTENRFRRLLEALPAAVYTTDADGTITYYNSAAIEMSGYAPEIGRDKWCVSWRLRTADGTPLPHEECPMAVALREDRPIRNVEAMVERPDGTLIPMLPHPTPLRDEDGTMIGAVNMLVDISERKQAENRQIVLLKELNHRVKNNMQMLQSLLTSAWRETSNPEARAVLEDAGRRVASMAAAQQVLYDDGRPTTFSAEDFLASVCAAVQVTLAKHVDIAVGTATGLLSNDKAMPLALIVNELLTNAVKHGDGGTIGVGIRQENGFHVLWVQDEGPGFDLGSATRKRSSGLGLVSGLARQLGGTFAVERQNGARCIVRFPERRNAPQ